MRIKYVRSVKPAVRALAKQPLTFTRRVSHRSRSIVIAGLALAFAISGALVSKAQSANDPIPGIDIIVRKTPGGITVAKGTTNRNGVFEIKLGPGDYSASTIISKSSIEDPIIALLVGLLVPAIVQDLVPGKTANIPFTVTGPADKKQTVTFKITERKSSKGTLKSTSTATQPTSQSTPTLAEQQRTVTTCTCPSGWLSHTGGGLGGVTTDGKCMMKFAQHTSYDLEGPPYGTAVGSWGFYQDEIFYRWGTPNNHGAASCVTSNTPGTTIIPR